jgi:hypothetical protein
MGFATFGGTAGMKYWRAVYDTLEPSGRPTTFSAVAALSTEPRKIDRKSRIRHPPGIPGHSADHRQSGPIGYSPVGSDSTGSTRAMGAPEESVTARTWT